MGAQVIDGKAIAQAVRQEVKADVAAWVAAGHRAPGLATILVGDDAASAVYIGGKQRASAEVGIEGFDHRLDEATPHEDVERLLRELNADPRVSGILLQLPTPPQVDGPALTELIDPAKDVDGLTPISAGLLAKGRPGLRPCTPSGVMEMLRRHDVALEGAEAVVIGRSDLVGKPLAALLLAANATVTVCHSRTRDLAEVARRADVLVAAVGRARFVEGDWVKEGATVIDVGINRTDDGLAGDVDYGPAAERASLITPVPGGVGPDDDRDAAAQHARGGEGAGGRRMRRVRSGEMMAGAGAAVLLLAMFLDWYTPRGREQGLSAWTAFSVLDLLLAVTIALGLALAILAGRRPRPRAARRDRGPDRHARARVHVAGRLPDPQPARAERSDLGERRGVAGPRVRGRPHARRLALAVGRAVAPGRPAGA